MQTLLQIRVDESIQQESYGVSLPLLTAYCRKQGQWCVLSDQQHWREQLHNQTTQDATENNPKRLC